MSVAKVKSIRRVLNECGCISVKSKSQDEFLAVACSPACIIEHFGDLAVLDVYAEHLSDEAGYNLVLLVA